MDREWKGTATTVGMRVGTGRQPTCGEKREAPRAGEGDAGAAWCGEARV
uniref:Uncharacterized protein n=1 Tax=Arundo donax TaxID=35708 RepID=A0A0A9BD48_ARUDO